MTARPRKPVRMLDADQLIAKLRGLAAHQRVGGFISHSDGVLRAVELIQRELPAKRKKPKGETAAEQI